MCPLSMAMKRQGLESLPWNQVSGSRPRPALPISSSPASKLKRSYPAPRRVFLSCPPGLRDSAGACRPQERRCWPDGPEPHLVLIQMSKRN